MIYCQDCENPLIIVTVANGREAAICIECKIQVQFRCQSQLTINSEKYGQRCHIMHHNDNGLCNRHQGYIAYEWEICPDCGDYRREGMPCSICFKMRFK